MNKQIRPAGIERQAPRRWGRFNAAYWGALLSLLLALAHSLHHVLIDEVTEANMLAHIFMDVIGFTAGGALLLLLITEVRNRWVQAR